MGFFAKLLGITPEKMPVHVEDATFLAEILRSKEPVILDIWGASCAACTKFEPIIKGLAAQYDGRVKVCELNTQLGPRTCVQLKVRSVPTVIYFKRGREVERITGMRGSLFHEETIQDLFGIPKEPEAE